MKYTIKIGGVETIYEGTPYEILTLYNQMNSEKTFIPEDSEHPAKQPKITNPYTTLCPTQPININPNINPWWTSPVYCQILSDSINKNLCGDLKQKFQGVHS